MKQAGPVHWTPASSAWHWQDPSRRQVPWALTANPPEVTVALAPSTVVDMSSLKSHRSSGPVPLQRCTKQSHSRSQRGPNHPASHSQVPSNWHVPWAGSHASHGTEQFQPVKPSPCVTP